MVESTSILSPDLEQLGWAASRAMDSAQLMLAVLGFETPMDRLASSRLASHPATGTLQDRFDVERRRSLFQADVERFQTISGFVLSSVADPYGSRQY